MFNFKDFINLSEVDEKQSKFTFAQINAKLNALEKMMAKEKNPQTLKIMNNTYQKLLDMMPLPSSEETAKFLQGEK